MVTNEDKIVADYMNWYYVEHEGIYYYDWDGRRQRNLDLTAAGLVVQEMQKRGDWTKCHDFLLEAYNNSINHHTPLIRSEHFSAWLFNADNFFNAMSEWLKERGK